MAVKVKKKNKIKKKNMVRQNGSGPAITNMLSEGIRFHQAGDFAEADSVYRKILEAEPGHPDALHLTGVIAHQTGKNELAVEYIQKAIYINSSVPFYHNNIGNALLNLKRTNEAVESFEEAIRLKPDYFEAYNNLGNAFRDQDRTDEAIEQFRKSIRLNPNYGVAHNNLANQLKDAGMLDEAVVHYRSAIKLKPDFAEAYFNLGNAFKEKGELDEAVKQYRRAIELRPDYVAPYNNLGNILKKQNRLDEAVLHFQKALELNPNFAEAYNNLGDAYRLQGRIDEAVALCEKAIELNPDNEKVSSTLANFCVNLGNTFMERGNFDEASEQYQKAIEINPDFADAHYNWGILLLLLGEFQKGWEEYKWRFRSSEISEIIGSINTEIPVWDGSSIEGKTILVRSEQGMGDHIQFMRYIPLIKEMGVRIIFECRKELERLFEDCGSIDVLLNRAYDREHDETPDVCTHLLSLPGIFGAANNTILADIPYMKIDDASVGKWKSRINKGTFKIGIVWYGNPVHKNDHNRSCKLTDLAPIADIPGVELYSLQKEGIGDGLPEGMKITDIGKDFEDFYDTAAAMENLDLVISVDTAVVHLAGALGRPVWTLLPFVPDWRWMLDREDTPWYPTMRLFRQPEYGDWGSVINKITDEINKQAQLKGAPNE